MKKILIIGVLLLLIACTQQIEDSQQEDSQGKTAEVEVFDEQGEVKVDLASSPDGKLIAGVPYEYSWVATGGVAITNSKVQASTTEDFAEVFESAPADNGPGIYKANLIVEAEEDQMFYIRAHAEIDGVPMNSGTVTKIYIAKEPSIEEADVIEVSMTAKSWDFSPSTFVVKKGVPVKLTVESIDIDHGIAIPEFGVSEKLVPGETVVIEFTPDKAGEFSFRCNVLCGAGHSTMTGTMIVEE